MLRLVVKNESPGSMGSAYDYSREEKLRLAVNGNPIQRFRALMDIELHDVLVEQEVPELFSLVRNFRNTVDCMSGHAQSGPGMAMEEKAPYLFLVTAEAMGADTMQLIPAACGMEFLAYLSSMRGKVPPVALADAANMGLALQGVAGRCVSRLKNKGVSAERVMETFNIIQETILFIAQGHFIVSRRGRDEKALPEEEYLDMARLKYGSLASCAAWSGAYLARGDKGLAGKFYGFGLHFGVYEALSRDSMRDSARSKVRREAALFYRDKALAFLKQAEKAAGVDCAELRQICLV